MATKIIERNKKYMVQFPTGTSTEKQAEYMTKVTNNLKTDQFVVVDPEIKLYEATEKEHVEIPDTEGKKDEIKDDKKTETKTPVDDTKKDGEDTKKKLDTNPETDKKDEENIDGKQETSKVNIEKVEVPTVKDEKTEAANLLVDDAVGRHGNVNEE